MPVKFDKQTLQLMADGLEKNADQGMAHVIFVTSDIIAAIRQAADAVDKLEQFENISKCFEEQYAIRYNRIDNGAILTSIGSISSSYEETLRNRVPDSRSLKSEIIQRIVSPWKVISPWKVMSEK